MDTEIFTHFNLSENLLVYGYNNGHTFKFWYLREIVQLASWYEIVVDGCFDKLQGKIPNLSSHV